MCQNRLCLQLSARFEGAAEVGRMLGRVLERGEALLDLLAQSPASRSHAHLEQWYLLPAYVESLALFLANLTEPVWFYKDFSTLK